jgi:RNA polymerase sigma-70 factor (ECF subfamily)
VLDLDHHLPEIVAGDPDAFAHWVAGAEHALRATLRSFTESVDVEVVVQETLLRVWQLAPRVRPDGRPNSLFRWAVTTARHLALSELRGRGRAGPGPPALAVDPLEPDPLLRRLVHLCLDLLPPQPRQAILARVEGRGGADDRALATGLRMKLNTFLQNVTRARKLLRECLESKGVDLEVSP